MSAASTQKSRKAASEPPAAKSVTSMLAARLHGPKDVRVEQVPHPGRPGPGQVLLRVRATGICGSDLHSYHDARIGDKRIAAPLILGHEFSGVVEAVGADSFDGDFAKLEPGARVAVDPAQPCGRCDLCEQGQPNLCRRLHFCGSYPDGGSLCEWMHMPAHACFVVPKTLDDAQSALLEPLGVAIHAVDLAKIRVARSVAILGAGPIGLLILQIARLSGADPIFVTDRFPWRLKLAQTWGAIPISCDGQDAARQVVAETRGRGVDIAIEAAWGEDSVEQAADMAALGGRVVLVGIPGSDRLTLRASSARRKGLNLVMCRRMKHVYPRAIRLAEQGRVDLSGLVSHRFPLRRATEAFALNADYKDNVVKVIIESSTQ